MAEGKVTEPKKVEQKITLGDLKVWVKDTMPIVRKYHEFSRSLKRSRETATVESAVRGIGTDMERLSVALEKISSTTGKKVEKKTVFPSPRG